MSITTFSAGRLSGLSAAAAVGSQAPIQIYRQGVGGLGAFPLPSTPEENDAKLAKLIKGGLVIGGSVLGLLLLLSVGEAVLGSRKAG